MTKTMQRALATVHNCFKKKRQFLAIHAEAPNPQDLCVPCPHLLLEKQPSTNVECVAASDQQSHSKNMLFCMLRIHTYNQVYTNQVLCLTITSQKPANVCMIVKNLYV